MSNGNSVQIAKSGKHISFFDFARSISMLYVVFVLHMRDYITDTHFLSGIQIPEAFTISALSVFTFISGYFLGKKSLATKRDVISFYKRRFWRIYPLYLLSCLTLYLVQRTGGKIYFTDLRQLLLSLTGIVCLIDASPLTIWYISMLLIFYLITPLLTCRRSLLYRIAASAFFYALFLFLHYFSSVNIDKRIVIYYPVYAAALLIGSRYTLSEKPSLIRFLVSAVLLLMTAVALNRFPIGGLGYPVISAASVFFVIELSRIACVSQLIGRISVFVGYGSMVSYLAHRQFFETLTRCLGKLHPLIIYCLLMPVFIFLCYALQKAYDRIIERAAR